MVLLDFIHQQGISLVCIQLLVRFQSLLKRLQGRFRRSSGLLRVCRGLLGDGFLPKQQVVSISHLQQHTGCFLFRLYGGNGHLVKACILRASPDHVEVQRHILQGQRRYILLRGYRSRVGLGDLEKGHRHLVVVFRGQVFPVPKAIGLSGAQTQDDAGLDLHPKSCIGIEDGCGTVVMLIMGRQDQVFQLQGFGPGLAAGDGQGVSAGFLRVLLDGPGDVDGILGQRPGQLFFGQALNGLPVLVLQGHGNGFALALVDGECFVAFLNENVQLRRDDHRKPCGVLAVIGAGLHHHGARAAGFQGDGGGIDGSGLREASSRFQNLKYRGILFFQKLVVLRIVLEGQVLGLGRSGHGDPLEVECFPVNVGFRLLEGLLLGGFFLGGPILGGFIRLFRGLFQKGLPCRVCRGLGDRLPIHHQIDGAGLRLPVQAMLGPCAVVNVDAALLEHRGEGIGQVQALQIPIRAGVAVLAANIGPGFCIGCGDFSEGSAQPFLHILFVLHLLVGQVGVAVVFQNDSAIILYSKNIQIYFFSLELVIFPIFESLVIVRIGNCTLQGVTVDDYRLVEARFHIIKSPIFNFPITIICMPTLHLTVGGNGVNGFDRPVFTCRLGQFHIGVGIFNGGKLSAGRSNNICQRSTVSKDDATKQTAYPDVGTIRVPCRSHNFTACVAIGDIALAAAYQTAHTAVFEGISTVGHIRLNGGYRCTFGQIHVGGTNQTAYTAAAPTGLQ